MVPVFRNDQWFLRLRGDVLAAAKKRAKPYTKILGKLPLMLKICRVGLEDGVGRQWKLIGQVVVLLRCRPEQGLAGVVLRVEGEGDRSGDGAQHLTRPFPRKAALLSNAEQQAGCSDVQRGRKGNHCSDYIRIV